MRWNIVIDLGTENARMAEAGREDHLDVPALLALRDGWDGPVAAGAAAHVLLGRTGPGPRVVAPLRDGVLENNLYAEQLLYWLLRQQEESRRPRRPAVLITQAPRARPVQQDALLRAALDAGAAEAALIRSDVAAALGAGVDPLAPEGRMVVDVGAGAMTASVFTLGRVAASQTLPYGLDRVCVEGYAFGSADRAYLRYGLYGADLVVGVHYGD